MAVSQLITADEYLAVEEERRWHELIEGTIVVNQPSTWRYDLGPKKRVYEAGGLPELWLVDTEADSVLVYRRSEPDHPRFDLALELAPPDELTSPLLEGFALPLAELFTA